MDLREFLTVRTEKIMRYLHNLAKTLPRVKSRNSRQTWLDHRKIKGLNDRYVMIFHEFIGHQSRASQLLPHFAPVDENYFCFYTIGTLSYL